jgi:ferredoxin
VRIYVPDNHPHRAFSIAAYDLTGNAWRRIAGAEGGNINDQNKFPDGWDEDKAQPAPAHCGPQTEDEARRARLVRPSALRLCHNSCMSAVAVVKMEPKSEGIATPRKKRPKELAIITECCTGCAGSPACVPYCPVLDCMYWVPDEDHPPFGRIEVDPVLCIGCKSAPARGRTAHSWTAARGTLSR